MRGSLLRFRRIRRRFLSERPLQRLELRVEFGHFLGFVVGWKGALPFRECAFHQRGGTLGLAHLHVHLSEMAQHGRVVRGLCRGLLQILFCFGQLALL